MSPKLYSTVVYEEDPEEDLSRYLSLLGLSVVDNNKISVSLSMYPHPKLLLGYNNGHVLDMTYDGSSHEIYKKTVTGMTLFMQIYRDKFIPSQLSNEITSAFTLDHIDKEYYDKVVEYKEYDTLDYSLERSKEYITSRYIKQIYLYEYNKQSTNPIGKLIDTYPRYPEIPTRLYSISQNKVLMREEIEEYGDPIFYCILSHAWKEDADQLKHTVPGCNWNVPIKDSEISTAVYFAKSFGLDWIWMDVLCINQDDNVEIEREVTRMRVYYKHAAVCVSLLSVPSHVLLRIIELGKSIIPNFPQATGPRLFSQKTMPDRQYSNNICSLVDSINTLSSDKWFERVWTFQEAVLCPKFVLASDNCCISIETLLPVIGLLGELKLLKNIPLYSDNLQHTGYIMTRSTVALINVLLARASFHIKGVMQLGHILELIETRKSKYNKDRVYGFLGLIPYGSDIDVLRNEKDSADDAVIELVKSKSKVNITELMLFSGNHITSLPNASCYPLLQYTEKETGLSMFAKYKQECETSWDENIGTTFIDCNISHVEPVFTSISQIGMHNTDGSMFKQLFNMSNLDKKDWIKYLGIQVECCLPSVVRGIISFIEHMATTGSDNSWDYPMFHKLHITLRSANVSMYTEVRKIVYSAVERIHNALGYCECPKLVTIDNKEFGWATDTTGQRVLWLGRKIYNEEIHNICCINTDMFCGIVVKRNEVGERRCGSICCFAKTNTCNETVTVA